MNSIIPMIEKCLSLRLELQFKKADVYGSYQISVSQQEDGKIRQVSQILPMDHLDETPLAGAIQYCINGVLNSGTPSSETIPT